MLPAGCAKRFIPDRVLASGGFGTVVLARQVVLDRLVAVKVLHADALREQEQVERFLSEARITAMIEDPHVVRLIDHGVDDGVPWIAYEYLEGRALAERLRAGPLSHEVALAAGSQVAAALAAAHRKGILHRDIKPANVLEASEGTWKVTDFGIARWTTGAAVKTKTGVLLGTPHYMAPEQVRGEPASAASDIYALGVMLHELIAGVPPFTGASPIEVLQRHMADPPPRLRDVSPSTPAAVEAYVLRMLEKHPAARPASAAQVSGDLAELAEAATGVVPSGVRRVSRKAAPAATSRAAAPPASTVVVRARAARRAWVPAVAAASLAAAVAAALVLHGRRDDQPDPRPSFTSSAPARLALPSPSPSPSPSPCGTDMVRVPGGTYTVGSDRKTGRDQEAKHGPAHKVRLSTFWIDRFEVTNRRFEAFRNSRPPSRRRQKVGGAGHPVVNVTWEEARDFCKWDRKRLPTEHEWEAAARGHRMADFPWDGPLAERALIGDSTTDVSGSFTTPGAQHRAEQVNDFMKDESWIGAIGMAGNVSEWCADWSSVPYYQELKKLADRVQIPRDPKGPPVSPGTGRVVRGGNWKDGADKATVWYRRDEAPGTAEATIGFRCACDGG
jgi:serine/threonine-protein kinase